MAFSAKLWKQQKSKQAPYDDRSWLATSRGPSQVVGQRDMPLAMHSSAGERGRPQRKGRRHGTRSTASTSSSSSLITNSQQHPSSNLWSWRAHLPQSGDDRAVIDRTRQVFALADQYVSNYYQNLRLQTMKHSQVFSSLELPYLPQGLQLEEALYKFNNPKAIIKHCLVQALMLMISFDARGPFSSLLPPEFTMLAKSLRMTTSAMDVADSHAAFSAYRVLSSYLRPDVLGGSDPFHSTRQQVIADTLNVFCAFDPWLYTDKSRDRRETSWINLMLRASELGVFLYSQASTFLFQWPVESPTEGIVRIAISPHLLKVYDEDAQRLESAQLMLSFKSEEAWDISVPSNTDPYEVVKPAVRDEERAIYQQPHKVQPNKVRRKPLATHENTVSELDGRDSVQGRSPTMSSLSPSQAWTSISELPTHSRQAVELDTQPSRSRRNSGVTMPTHNTPQYWKQATELPSGTAAIDGYIQQRQDRHSARHTPPSAYPTNGPNPTVSNGSYQHTRESPEVPMRQSSTTSTRRRSLSLGRRPAPSSDHVRPQSSQGSDRVQKDESPAGPGPGRSGNSETSRFKSLRGSPIAPESHSKRFEHILSSKPEELHLADRPLPPRPSENSQLVRQQSNSRGIEAGNNQNGLGAGHGGGEPILKKEGLWSRFKGKTRAQGYLL